MGRRKTKEIKKQLIGLIFILVLIGLSSIFGVDILNNRENERFSNETIETNIDISEIPEYQEKIYIEINNNKPYFKEEDYTKESFEKYSDLDDLGRCGAAFANISKSIMPKEGEERESISNVKPTGWVQEKYNGEYLYNRCHLIGYQLSGENDNELNLITGTRYFNVEGMLPFENKVADYIEDNQENHVLYRVTPVFENDNLLAKGVEIEAYSIEDNGEGICFNVFIYNVEPEVNINYATGESSKK